MKTKKLLISIFIFFLIFIVWGLILFSNLKNKNDLDDIGKWQQIEINEITKYEPKENYNIYEVGNLKSIKNENIGLEFKVLEKWSAKIIEYKDISEIKLTSPDFESGINFPEKGCEIKVGAVYFIKNDGLLTKPEIIQEKLKEENLIDNVEKIVFIDNHPALKTIQYENPKTGGIITVEKPFYNKNGLYFFNIYYPKSEKTKCLNYFDNFLKSISINQASF